MLSPRRHLFQECIQPSDFSFQQKKHNKQDKRRHLTFCFQCEQTAKGKGCTKIGVCGKQPKVTGSKKKPGLYLGIKDIRLGPSLPAFVSQNVLKVLVEKSNIMPIKTPEEDLKAILG